MQISKTLQMLLTSVLTSTLILASFGYPDSASAGYYSTMDTGRLLQSGHYKLGVETQFITEGNDGVNLTGRFEGPYNDEVGWKVLAGVGTVDVHLGGFVKWVPIPDYNQQPAIGLLIGVLYANYNDLSELNLRVHPFISKNFALDFGDLTPYAALPLGVRTADGSTQGVSQFAIGAEFKPDSLQKARFLAEMGFEIGNSFPYFSLGATLEYDEENGIELK